MEYMQTKPLYNQSFDYYEHGFHNTNTLGDRRGFGTTINAHNDDKDDARLVKPTNTKKQCNNHQPKHAPSTTSIDDILVETPPPSCDTMKLDFDIEEHILPPCFDTLINGDNEDVDGDNQMLAPPDLNMLKLASSDLDCHSDTYSDRLNNNAGETASKFCQNEVSKVTTPCGYEKYEDDFIRSDSSKDGVLNMADKLPSCQVAEKLKNSRGDGSSPISEKEIQLIKEVNQTLDCILPVKQEESAKEDDGVILDNELNFEQDIFEPLQEVPCLEDINLQTRSYKEDSNVKLQNTLYKDEDEFNLQTKPCKEDINVNSQTKPYKEDDPINLQTRLYKEDNNMNKQTRSYKEDNNINLQTRPYKEDNNIYSQTRPDREENHLDSQSRPYKGDNNISNLQNRSYKEDNNVNPQTRPYEEDHYNNLTTRQYKEDNHNNLQTRPYKEDNNINSHTRSYKGDHIHSDSPRFLNEHREVPSKDHNKNVNTEYHDDILPTQSNAYGDNLPNGYSDSYLNGYSDTLPIDYNDNLPNSYSDHLPNAYNDNSPNDYSDNLPNDYNDNLPNAYNDNLQNAYSDTSPNGYNNNTCSAYTREFCQDINRDSCSSYHSEIGEKDYVSRELCNDQSRVLYEHYSQGPTNEYNRDLCYGNREIPHDHYHRTSCNYDRELPSDHNRNLYSSRELCNDYDRNICHSYNRDYPKEFYIKSEPGFMPNGYYVDTGDGHSPSFYDLIEEQVRHQKQRRENEARINRKILDRYLPAEQVLIKRYIEGDKSHLPIPPVNMEIQEIIKRERKKHKNRMAASKCRKKKLEREAQLEVRVNYLKERSVELNSVVRDLRNQATSLKQKIMEHINAGCTLSTTNTTTHVSTSSGINHYYG